MRKSKLVVSALCFCSIVVPALAQTEPSMSDLSRMMKEARAGKSQKDMINSKDEDTSKLILMNKKAYLKDMEKSFDILDANHDGNVDMGEMTAASNIPRAKRAAMRDAEPPKEPLKQTIPPVSAPDPAPSRDNNVNSRDLAKPHVPSSSPGIPPINESEINRR